MPTTTTGRVRRYLDDLDRALRNLPRDRRQEIVRDIRAHIDGALADFDAPTDVEVEQILDGLGTPEEIAQAAYEELPAKRERIAGRDLLAVILLLAGGFVFCVGWIVGVVLLWSSSAWETKDKVMATLLVPGGLLTGLLLAGGGTGLAAQECTSENGGPEHCHGFVPGGFAGVFAVMVLIVSVVGPFVTMAVLLRNARRD